MVLSGPVLIETRRHRRVIRSHHRRVIRSHHRRVIRSHHWLETDFARQLVRLNDLGARGFDCWLFEPGMRFGDLEQWWGTGGVRSRPHEGLDFLGYRDQQGGEVRLAAGALVPALADGEVVRVFPDFLGASLVTAHQPVVEGYRLYSIFGHIEPGPGIGVGSRVSAGEVVAVIAQSNSEKVAPHLHLSVAWLADGLSGSEIDWPKLVDPLFATLCDPLILLAVH